MKKPIMISTLFRTITVLVSVVLLSSCGEEGLAPVLPTGTTVEATFTLNIGNNLLTTSGTRAADSEPLQRVDVLAYYEDENSGNHLLGYRITPEILYAPLLDYIREVNVKLPVSDTPYQFVVFANLDDDFFENNGITEGSDRSELSSLEFVNTGEWGVDTPIPMWGEIEEKIVVDGLNPVVKDVRLLRMLARVDINMALEDPGLFQLEEVWVYNTNTNGMVVPDAGNLINNGTKVNAPTLPATIEKLPTPILYETDQQYVQGIYTFELEQTDPDTTPDPVAARANAPCLVIGGKYAHDTKTTYYRVNIFIKGDGGLADYYPDLLRNHRYQLQILNIYGKGYDSVEVALNSTPAVTTQLIEWKDSDTDILFDGENQLAISQNTFEFPVDAGSGLLTVTTSLQQWMISIEENARSWLILEYNSHTLEFGSSGKRDISFYVAQNQTGNTRQGYITITAGDFRHEVLVIQTMDEHIALSIRDRNGNDVDTLVFASHISDLSVIAQELNVSWSPASSPCIISATQGERPFEYGAGSAMLGDGTSAYGGKETFRIFPKELTRSEVEDDPFIEKIKYLDFMVTNENHYATKRIVLRQVNYALLVDDKLDEYEHEFIMGRDYSVTVKSNAEWSGAIKTNFTGSISDILEVARVEGNTFHFRIRNVAEWYGRTIPISLYSTNPEHYFDPIDINLRAIRIFPNCYLVKPGGSVSIPVEHIYDIQRKYLGTDLTGQNMSARMVWQDSKQLVNCGYSNGSIWVAAGNAQGNAVIALTANGEEVWSWHIWVTDYDPNASGNFITHTVNGFSNTFMRRNLGATSGTANQVNNMGLYYQWGRKDPFPGSRSTTANGYHREIYDQNGNVISVALDQVSNTDNLRKSIQEPLTFISSGNYPYDWYATTRENQDDYLWNDEYGFKTIFDPCPEGWRVPYISEERTPWGNVPSVNLSSNGVNFPLLGHYPLAGSMNYQTGQIEHIPTRTFNWTGSPAMESAHNFTAGYYTIDGMDIRYRATGAKIRCVKYE